MASGEPEVAFVKSHGQAGETGGWIECAHPGCEYEVDGDRIVWDQVAELLCHLLYAHSEGA